MSPSRPLADQFDATEITRISLLSDRLIEHFPARLVAADLMVIFGIGKSQFYRLESAGRFQRLELRPRIGRKAWSRTLVQDWLDQAGAFARGPFERRS